MNKGDIFDKGNNEYIEFLESKNSKEDKVILYTRESEKPYLELKVAGTVPSEFLEANYRMIGPNEKKRLLAVWINAKQIIKEGFED
ncbi:MAG: hypothetical protein JEY99_11400 [Spirochaetales bacterium]|nr:hypothetical protein [Spirochaetales bacterium]